MSTFIRMGGALLLSICVQAPAIAQQEVLRPGRETPGTLNDKGTASYRIALNADETLEVEVTQPEADLRLRLLDPSGLEVMRSNLRRPQHGPEQLHVVAASSGDHELIVENAGAPAANVTFAVRVLAIRLADERDRTLTAAAQAYRRGEIESARGGGDALRAGLRLFRQAAAEWKTAGATFEAATAWNRIGGSEMQISNLVEASAAFDEALRLRREIGDQYGQGVALNNLAAVNVRQGNYAQANAFYEQAIAIRRAVGDANGEGWSLIGWSVSHATLHDSWASTLVRFNEALALMEKTSDERGSAEAYYYLGYAHKQLNRFDEATALFDKSLAVRTRQKDLAGQASILTQLAAIQLQLGDQQRALEFLDRALPLRRAGGDRRGEGYTLQTVGVAYNRLGNRARALESLGQALKIFEAVGDREGQTSALTHMAAANATQGDHQLALDLAIRARSVLKGARTLITTILLSVTADAQLALGRVDQAAASYAEGLSDSRRLGEPLPAARALAGLGRVALARGQLMSARQHLLEALDAIESVRAGFAQSEMRASLLGESQGIYDAAIDVLVELHQQEPAAGYAAEALEVSERRRARTLVEMLVEAQAALRAGADEALLEREQTTQQQLNAMSIKRAAVPPGSEGKAAAADLDREISELVARLRSVRAEIRVRNPRYAAIMHPAPLDLRGIQQLLDPQTLMLEYSLAEKRSYLWAITPAAITLHLLPGRRAIENAVGRARGLVADSSRRAVRAPMRQALDELSVMILGPLGRELGHKRLVIVADGALQYLPFAALPNPSQRSKGDAEPLMVRHEIVMLPSASTVAVLRQSPRLSESRKSVAVLADPVMEANDSRFERTTADRAAPPLLPRDLARAAESQGTATFDRLPYSRDEALAIAAHAGPARSLTALGFEATRDLAMSPAIADFRIVHFATHALLDTRHPELSGIVLSLLDRQGQPLNGFLRLHDIFKLRLSAEVIVLSGCQTALGQDVRGEGLIGLTRGFMHAGAAQVVASLWNIRDRATAALMGRFYTALLERGQTPAAALRTAQLSMWKDERWRMPAYWAGFIVQGDWADPPSSVGALR
jgi:CHAT domain-containing protein